MPSLREQVEQVYSVLLLTDGSAGPLPRLFARALESGSEEALHEALECWFAEGSAAVERRLAIVASQNAEGILRSFALTRAAAAAVLELAHAPEWRRLIDAARFVADLPRELTPLERARAVQAFDEAQAALRETPRRAHLSIQLPSSAPEPH